MADLSKWKGAPRTRVSQLGGREIVSEGLSQNFWTDLNHRAMTASWPVFIASALGLFLTLNLLFASIYALGTDPIANAAPGGIAMLFFFSVETLATVGYGDMHPQSVYGHVVATAEIFTGMTMIAVMTGLVFSRFSRPRARLIFANRIVIGQHDGQPTLMVRLANARQNRISGATARLWVLATQKSLENRSFRRFRELKLVSNENPAFALSWTLFHVIDSASPLAGAVPASLEDMNADFLLTVTGLDEQLVQELHARTSYSHADIAWGSQYVDILANGDDGRLHIDYNRIHDIEPEAMVRELANGLAARG